MKAKLIIILTAMTLLLAAWSYETTKEPITGIANSEIIVSRGPASIRMYDYLEHYANKYDVPMYIALGIAREETGYKGPFQWSYNHKQVSSTGACGAMQVLPSTASYVWKRKVTAKELTNDLEFNIETSMKYIAYLHKISKRWDIALGYYNTGYPIVNAYAARIINNKS